MNFQEYKDHLQQEGHEMFDLCKKQLENAHEAFLNHDNDLAEEVLRTEARVNALDLKIDRDCERFIALHTQVAGDLRFVLAQRKINFDLERIGDHAYGISNFIINIDRRVSQDQMEKLQFKAMYEGALSMLEDVSLAYAEGDTKIARKVFKKDKLLNGINENAVAVIAEEVKKDPQTIEQYLLLFSVIKKLERIGDLVTNIAEEIIFYRKAEVIKHKKKKQGKKKE